MLSTVLRIPISSEAQWLDLRRQNVGASEIAALFGRHPYLTAYGLAGDKSGRIPKQDHDSAAMERGRELEPIAIKKLGRMFPRWRLEAPGTYFVDQDLRFGATPDLFAIDDKAQHGVIQIKSVEPSVFGRTWRDEAGELSAPLHVALQAIAEGHLTGADWCAAAAIVVGFGIDVHVVDVPIVPGVIARMRQEVREFWDEIANGITPDPDYGRDGALIAAMLRQDDGTEIDLRSDNEIPELVEKRAAAADLAKAGEAEVRRCTAEILHKLGSAQRARFAGGLITAKTVHRTAHDVPATSYRQVRVRRDREDAA